jgi:hypothetical protein
MIQLTVSIEDTRTGHVEERVLGDWYACCGPGVIIGTDADCAVRLVGPELAGRHARYYGRGHHQYIELIDEAELRRYRERYGRYLEDNSLRVDRGSFTLGPYTLTFDSRRDSSPETPQ